MRRIRNRMFFLIFVSGLFAMVAIPSQAAGQSPDDHSARPIRSDAPEVAAGEAEAKKLLLLMDTDKSGKVSKEEFMRFMAAEFDRLDVNKDGELDVKELEKSQLMTVHRGGAHR